MTDSMDDVSSGQQRSNQGASDGVGPNPPSIQLGGSPKPQQSSGANPVPQPQDVDVYSESNHFITPGSGHGPSPSFVGMGDMRSALPGYHSSTTHYNQHPMQHQFYPSHTHMIYPMHPMSSYHGTPSGGGTAYNVSFSHYPPYMHPHQHSPLAHGTSVYQSYIPNPPAHQGAAISTQPAFSHTYYAQQTYPTPLGHSQMASSTQFYTRPSPQHHKPQNSISKLPNSARKDSGRTVPNMTYDVNKTIVDGSTPMKLATTYTQVSDAVSTPSTPSGPVTPRGPPRKPKQSGHALWVGNLPPGAGVVELKDHFARDATSDIESVFLISKSNCAFVNYKSEIACAAALARFNDSKFQGVRLVCRLRRGLVPGGSRQNLASPSLAAREEDELKSGVIGFEEPLGIPETSQSHEPSTTRPSRVPNRYFIVKSLTMEDLELSRQSGIWATQNHNEGNLNQAFETADNVYLIFSANKSGEYYGYARMLSPIVEDEALALEMPPRPDHGVQTEELNVSQTQATSTAPSGRIIDDSARGTIFWEADSSEEEEDDDVKSEKSAAEPVEEPPEPGSQSIGNPFRIQWLSTGRVPFHRTRGLRNPWNANREVKIARDGTEIEPGAGAKLLQLFQTPKNGFQVSPTYELPN